MNDDSWCTASRHSREGRGFRGSIRNSTAEERDATEGERDSKLSNYSSRVSDRGHYIAPQCLSSTAAGRSAPRLCRVSAEGRHQVLGTVYDLRFMIGTVQSLVIVQLSRSPHISPHQRPNHSSHANNTRNIDQRIPKCLANQRPQRRFSRLTLIPSR